MSSITAPRTASSGRPDAPPPEATYDVVVVGARCAGSAAAVELARAGRRVLLVDRADFPSDTVSTHQLFPDSLALLDRLGSGERLRARHRLRPVQYSWRVLGHAAAGTFTPVGGHDRSLSVRRIALDVVLQETARAAGAVVRRGAEVVGLLGSGTPEDPVRGVVLADGTRALAPWVIGADGRRSLVARRVGAALLAEERRGEMAMLLAYWERLPDTDWCHIDVHEGWGLQSSPCEDGLHLLSLAGDPSITRGSAEELQARYLAGLRRFPAVLNPRLLDTARQVTPVAAAPETMLRGHVRQATGPGWALVGDAGLTCHPSTGQGIGDALAAGSYVGQALARDGDLSGYQAWRDERAAGHVEFSFRAAIFPRRESVALHAGLAGDPEARREFLDSFTRRHRPDRAVTAERAARWRAAWVHETGLAELRDLVEPLDETDLRCPVPACPAWTVGDLVAHLVGVAEDSARGRFFDRALHAWVDADAAAAREQWTDSHVRRWAGRSQEDLLRGLARHGEELVRRLRAGHNPVAGAPDWGWAAPVADLAVHLADLREALGAPSDPSGPVAGFGFAAYREWLGQRLDRTGRPALVLDDGTRRWQVGAGDPEATVTAERHELFRMVSGRRSERQVAAYDWSVDPRTTLGGLNVLAPYPLPT